MSVKPTITGLHKISKPYIKYDSIVFTPNKGVVEFKLKNETIGTIKLACSFNSGDTFTLHGIKGKVEIDTY